MFGAIIGDIVGSVYEFDINNIKTKDFLFFNPSGRFTDDSVLTFAVYSALLKCKNNYKKYQKILIKQMVKLCILYPSAGYGANFAHWIFSKDHKPYSSFGNGSAMRISPVAYFAKNIEELKTLSKLTTDISHNHPEGLKGAEATAVAIFMALQGKSKTEIKKCIEENYYSLDFNYEELIKKYKMNESCQGTVPQAIYCFLISENFEDAIRTAISIGGDSDTIGAITGSIAGAFYGIPENIIFQMKTYFDKKKDKYLLKLIIK